MTPRTKPVRPSPEPVGRLSMAPAAPVLLLWALLVAGGAVGAVHAVPVGAQSAQSSPVTPLTLLEALDAALAASPELAGAEAGVRGAEAGASAARAARMPALGVQASLTRFEEPMVVAPLHAFDPARPPSFDRTLVQGRLALAYTIFDAGERSARVGAAEAQAGAALQGRAATEMALLERATAAYVGLLSARAVRDAARAQVEALEAEAGRARQRVAVGSAAEVEAMRAAAALQDARAQETGAAAGVGLAERSLARLMGAAEEELTRRTLEEVRPRAEVIAIGDSGAEPLRPPPGGGVVAETIHPLVGRAERTVAAAEARVGEARAGRIPRLEASAGLLDYGTVRGDHVTEWQAGVQLSWPVFTGGARRASIRRAEAEAAGARAARDATALEVRAAEDAAATALERAQALATALEASVAQWREVARIERLALDTGAGVQSDLLRAEAGLFQARAGLAQAHHDAALALVRLAHARGILARSWLARALETQP